MDITGNNIAIKIAVLSLMIIYSVLSFFVNFISGVIVIITKCRDPEFQLVPTNMRKKWWDGRLQKFLVKLGFNLFLPGRREGEMGSKKGNLKKFLNLKKKESHTYVIETFALSTCFNNTNKTQRNKNI